MDGQMTCCGITALCTRHSRSYKVIDFGTNWKRILVCYSNLGPILHRFRDIAAFMFSWIHPYSTLILVVFPFHQIAHVGVSVSRCLKLFSRETVFEVFQHMWSWYLNVTDRHTDRQMTYKLITILCIASRGNGYCFPVFCGVDKVEYFHLACLHCMSMIESSLKVSRTRSSATAERQHVSYTNLSRLAHWWCTNSLNTPSVVQLYNRLAKLVSTLSANKPCDIEHVP